MQTGSLHAIKQVPVEDNLQDLLRVRPMIEQIQSRQRTHRLGQPLSDVTPDTPPPDFKPSTDPYSVPNTPGNGAHDGMPV